jgi:ankyrin repeat protein
MRTAPSNYYGPRGSCRISCGCWEEFESCIGSPHFLDSSARNGLLGVYRKLLEVGAHIESADSRTKNISLKFAAKYGHCLIVVHLIERCADIFVKNSDGKTPYDLALKFEHTNCLNCLKSGRVRPE